MINPNILKKSLKISQKFKKRISLLLLLNFISYTALLALPQKECDGICSIKFTGNHDCLIEEEMTCCDMMEADVNYNSFSSETEITQNSCDYEYLVHEQSNYIIPKTNDTAVDLSEFIVVILDIESKTVQKYFITKNIISEVSPPIYLKVSSFLI